MNITTEDPRPRLLFLNRSYWPDQEATGQLLTELCEGLTDRFRPHVIAGQPNSPQAGVNFRRCGRETHGGVTISRVPHTVFAKRRIVGRLANMASYTLASSVVASFQRRPDAIIAETDPPSLCLIAHALKLRYRCPLILYLQDIYPDIAVALGKAREGSLVKSLRAAMRYCCTRAERVVVLSDDMRATLLAWGVADARIDVIPNWADTRRLRPVKVDNALRREWGLDGKFVVMYSGNLGLSQRLGDVLRCAERLRDRPDIQFLLVGQGAAREELQREAERKHLTNVRFLPYQSKSRLGESLSAADLQLVSVDERVLPLMMPSKLYGILAAGTASLVSAPESSELHRLVEQEKVGRTIPSGCPDRMAEAIVQCRENPTELAAMGRRARELAERQFDRRIVTGQFMDLVDDVLAQRASDRQAGRSAVATRTS